MPAKPRLSREAVVTAALRVADEDGLEAVTIRRLAGDLGVTPMALYWHFEDKTVLLDAVVDRVLDETELQRYAQPPAWDERLADLFGAMTEGLRRHPAVAPLVHRRLMKCDSGLAISRVCADALVDAGLDDQQLRAVASHAFNTIIASVTMPPEDPALRSDEWYAFGTDLLLGGIRRLVSSPAPGS